MAGEVYAGMACVRTITEIEEIFEISLVDRPANPDARIHSVSVSHAELVAIPGWEPGKVLSCDLCLARCSDVTYFGPRVSGHA